MVMSWRPILRSLVGVVFISAFLTIVVEVAYAKILPAPKQGGATVEVIASLNPNAPLVLPGGIGRVATSGEFSLPRRPGQGVDNHWYLLNAQLHLEAAPSVGGSSDQISTISISSNGGTVGILEVTREQLIMVEPFLEWRTLELISGGARGVVLGGILDLQFKNYFGYKDLKFGALNQLGLSLKQSEEIIGRVTLGSEGLVMHSVEGPPSLELGYSTLDCRADQRTLRVRAKSAGRQIKAFGIEVLPPPQAVVLDGPRHIEEFKGEMILEFTIVNLEEAKNDQGIIKARGANIQPRGLKVTGLSGEC
jgi:hypothetical protein